MASNGVTRPPALDVTMQEILDALKAVSFRPQVIDNLTSQDSGAPLSANQGRVLKDAIDDIVIQSITDGDTAHAPSGDAVHDAINAIISGTMPVSQTTVYQQDMNTIRTMFAYFVDCTNAPTGYCQGFSFRYGSSDGVQLVMGVSPNDPKIYIRATGSGDTGWGAWRTI